MGRPRVAKKRRGRRVRGSREELQAEAVFHPAEPTPSLIVTGWLESGAEGGRAFDLERLDARAVVRHLESDARPERKPRSSGTAAPARSVA